MEKPKQTHTGRSILKNAVYGFSTWILPFSLSFFSVPIIVRSLGDRNYGIYALVLGFIAYSFNFNFGRAITKYIAEYRASGETEKIREVISATFFINLTFGLISVLIIFLSAEYLVVNAFQIEEAEAGKSILALRIAALTVFFLVMNQVFNSILQGIHRFDIYSKITNFNSAAVIIGNVILVLLGYGLTVLLGWNLFITGVTCFLFALSAKRALPEFGINFKIKKTTIAAVLKFSSGVIGYQMLANLFILFERGWIMRQLGAENLTFYVVTMSLSIYIHSFISSFVLIIFPLASELQNNTEKLLRLYTKATKIVCFLVIFIGASVIVHSRDFLDLWMGESFSEKAYPLLILHTITFSLLAIQVISWQMTEGLGYPRFNALIYAISLVFNWVLMILLTQTYQNTGIALSRTIGFALLFLSIFYCERWFFGKIQYNFWAKTFLMLGAAVFLSIIFQKFIIQTFPINWATLLGAFFGGGVVYCLFLILFGYLNEEDKLILKNILKRAG